MKDFIMVFKNAASNDLCDSLISDWDNLLNVKQEGETDYDLGVRKDISLRNDTAIALAAPQDRDSHRVKLLKQQYYSKIMEIVSTNSFEYQKKYNLVLPFPLELNACQFQKSEAADSGGYHAFHFECVGGQADWITRRVLAWMIYLNDVPEGEGETEFLAQGRRVQPKKGDLVIWPAAFTHIHRGNPVYTTDKYITTGWILWPTHQMVDAFTIGKKEIGAEAPRTLEAMIVPSERE
tara:strand:- start:56 stop:763 length:708 start_codon:yes stop_codon:yes gene_type:complete